MSDNNRKLHELITGKGCICPTECDCENEASGLVSNECPVHNDYPQFTEGCPVHDDGDFIPAYDTDISAAMEAVEWAREERELLFNLSTGFCVAFQDQGDGFWTAVDVNPAKAITLALIEALEAQHD